MAYNEEQMLRIRQTLRAMGAVFAEKKMFSGICFMVDDKMCCGIHTDKDSGEEWLLCRIGEEAYPEAIETQHCIPMEMTGKAMKGYVFVKENGFKTQHDLEYWLQLCLDFNPFAKKSKK